jgi:hypothetical protein
MPPHLSPATHLTPDDGACLMEAVSAAAGLPWSDDPACTHPLLAHLARLVNDATTDAGRQQLVALVTPLASATSRDPAAKARTAAELALACVDEALLLRPTPLLAHLHRVAASSLERERRPASTRAGRLALDVRRRAFLRGPGARAVEQSVLACQHLPVAERDVALVRLLQQGVRVVAGDDFRPQGRSAGGATPEPRTASDA